MKNASARKPVAPVDENDAGLAVSLKLWVVLARAFTAVGGHVDTNIAQHDLTTAEFGILEVLLHKGPLLLGEIQRKILVTSGGITYLVDRLVDKGLVKREECPNDRRARYAVLTPAGDALIRRLFPDHFDFLIVGAGRRQDFTRAEVVQQGVAADGAASQTAATASNAPAPLRGWAFSQ